MSFSIVSLCNQHCKAFLYHIYFLNSSHFKGIKNLTENLFYALLQHHSVLCRVIEYTYVLAHQFSGMATQEKSGID